MNLNVYEALLKAGSTTTVIAIVTVSIVMLFFKTKFKDTQNLHKYKIIAATICLAITAIVGIILHEDANKKSEVSTQTTISTNGDKSPAIQENNGIINYGKTKK